MLKEKSLQVFFQYQKWHWVISGSPDHPSLKTSATSFPFSICQGSCLLSKTLQRWQRTFNSHDLWIRWASKGPLIPVSFYIHLWFSFLNLLSNQSILRNLAKEMWSKEETENLSLVFAWGHCISCPMQQLFYIFLVYSFITGIMVEALLVLCCIFTFINYVFSEHKGSCWALVSCNGLGRADSICVWHGDNSGLFLKSNCNSSPAGTFPAIASELRFLILIPRGAGREVIGPCENQGLWYKAFVDCCHVSPVKGGRGEQICRCPQFD